MLKSYFSSLTTGLPSARSTLSFLLWLHRDAAAGILTRLAGEHWAFPVLVGLSATSAASRGVCLKNARNRPSSTHHDATLPPASWRLCLHQPRSNSFTTDDSQGYGHGDPPRTQVRGGKGCPGWNGANS